MNRIGLVKGTLLFVKLKLNLTKQIQIQKNMKYPVYLRPNTSDKSIFELIFIDNEYKMFQDITPKTIIDAGANIGLSTVFFKNKFPNANVICIEPDASNFEVLAQNTKPYGNDITLIQKGLWNKITKTKISDKYNMGKWAMVIEEDLNNSADSLDTITIDKIMEDHKLERIDLLKIDIETAEKYVFMNNYENWLPKTKMIIIELHDWMEKGTAQPFFMAITKSIANFSIYHHGELTTVINEDL
ncbi:MAG: FkbM family methyltransferase [Pseudarcicella sp.]|jgi:FkbM family methyltransferase|nr:FkbM family methyltransferase [Pseudarcicella sp.]MBP6411195.1 FkbM family methyltransferase [Pseudarcicella sp.]